VDVLVLGMVAVGLIIGLMRGFLLQFTGLAAILGGLYLADRYHGRLAEVLGRLFHSENTGAIAFVAIVIATVLVVALISSLCRRALEKLRLGAYDRLLGGLFGALKAGVISAGILLTFVAFAADGGSIQRAIGSSRSAPVLWDAIGKVADLLPERMSGDVKQFLGKNPVPRASPPPSSAPPE